MLTNRLSSIILLILLVWLAGCSPSTTAPAGRPTPSATLPQAAPTSTTSEEATRVLFPDVPTATLEASPATSPPPIDYEHAIPHLDAGTAIEITKITMVDSQQGWAIAQANDSSDHILRTNDGGESWWDVTPPETAPTGDSHLQAAGFFLNSDHAWVSFSSYEIVWRTSDAGITWQPARTEYTGNLGVDFYFADETYGWVMKYIDAGMSHVYSSMSRTTSGGAYWETVFDPYTSSDLQSFTKTGMVFIDADVGWVTRDSYGVQPGAFVDVTSDGGSSWKEVPLPPPPDEPNKFTDEYCAMYNPHLFSRSNGALIVRCTTYDNNNNKVLTDYLFSTSDSGQTWSRYDYPGGELQFIDEDVAYALDREIYRSRDAGITWSQVKDVNWTGQFSFVGENLAWVVARSGEEIALVKTTDGCASFTEIKPELVAEPSEYQAASERSTEVGSLESLTGQIGFIAFSETDSDISDIFLMNLEDDSRQKITDSSGEILHFSWSPDGQRLVFDSDRDGNFDIYTMQVDGSQLTQLTKKTIPENDPDWSPNGTQIIYTVSEAAGWSIYVMNADGSQSRRLTNGYTASWSPDGSRIAFSRLDDGIYTMDPGGGNLVRLTDSSTYGWDYYPEWSPDGTKIVFGSNRRQPGDALTESVYIMDADGQGIGRLSDSWGQAPYAWSPDGRWIVYTKGFFSTATLYIMDSFGVNSAALAENNIGFHPAWRP